MLDSKIVDWNVEDAVATDCNITSDKANKVIKLINDGSTIPFIARYRKECTGNLPPTTLHKIKEKMEECQTVIEQVEKSMKTIEKTGMLSDNVKVALRRCKTIEDVEFVTEPFKVKGPRSLAGRARQAGLEPLALKILFEREPFIIENFVPQSAIEEFGDLHNIEEALRNIIADVFAKDITLLDGAEKLNCPSSTNLQSRLKKTLLKPDPKKKIDDDTKVMVEKLKTYHDFTKPIGKLYPHQVMAINRGEKNKILKVSIQFPDSLRNVFIDLCNKRYLFNMVTPLKEFVTDCALDAYNRLVQPHLTRKIRNKLTKEAQIKSLDVFESNLRQLVMTSPLRGVPILGMDPGYYHGTKLAVIDINSQVCETSIIYLTRTADMLKRAQTFFVEIVLKYKIEYIAIGDGNGSDKTSKFVSDMIATKVFASLNVRFAIVRECGASVWSISNESSKEFPDLDATVRSAVSIARRLQDPLAEYVKMDPKCLGVGMYQHDLADKALVSKVNTVLDDCISFIGVDINHAPVHVLQHVSGFGPLKAKAIIDHREKSGYFKNRQQLLNVRGIGELIFTQCAGFIRIKNTNYETINATKNFAYEPDGKGKNGNTKNKTIQRDAMMTDVSEMPRSKVRKRKADTEVNPLDQTSIHPESYGIAERIINFLGLEPSDVGTTAMQQAIKIFMTSSNYLNVLSSFMTDVCGKETLADIVINLSRPLEFDERNNFGSSMLRQSYGSSYDLRVQQTVIGFVTNVTTFGIFIDIGVERSAFCHKLIDGVVLGDTVEAIVTLIDTHKLSVDQVRKVPRF